MRDFSQMAFRMAWRIHQTADEVIALGRRSVDGVDQSDVALADQVGQGQPWYFWPR
jgi:hypothetical protein